MSSPIDEMVRYVGITSGTLSHRLSQHLCSKRTCKKTSWIISLKNKNITPKIELLDIVDELNWAEEEKFYISYFRFLGFNLVNMKEGGERGVMTQEVKNKISLAHKGKKISQSHYENMCLANKLIGEKLRGRKQSIELINKRRLFMIGKKKEITQPILNHHIKMSKKIIQKTLEGIELKKWNSISECSRKNKFSKANIINVCKNKTRKDGSKCLTAYGYKWEYEK